MKPGTMRLLILVLGLSILEQTDKLLTIPDLARFLRVSECHLSVADGQRGDMHHRDGGPDPIELG